jgi:hypothetical protein
MALRLRCPLVPARQGDHQGTPLLTELLVTKKLPECVVRLGSFVYDILTPLKELLKAPSAAQIRTAKRRRGRRLGAFLQWSHILQG